MRPYRRHARALYRLYSAGLAALTRVKPLFRLALRVLTGRWHSMRGHVLPVHAVLGEPVQESPGRQVLEELIGRSAAVAVMDECLCRTVGGCSNYPADLGCLVLGGAVDGLHPGLGHAVSREDALAHVDRALALGLTPMVIHFKSDAALWSLEHGRMLTVCFCCPCHCLVRQAVGLRRGGDRRMTGLAGVSIGFDAGKCAGCGRCAAACFAGTLSMRDGRAHIDERRCLRCGRCAMVCPRGALTVQAGAGASARPLVEEYARRTGRNGVFTQDV